MTMPADRERDRRSLQDLAKMAQGLTPPPASVVPSPSGVMRAAEANDDDSGIVDLAAASTADPAAAMRAQTTALASQGLFDDDARSQPPMSAAPQSAPVGALPAQPAPSIPPPASVTPQALTPAAPAVASNLAPAVSSSAHALPAKVEKKGGGAVIALVIGGVVALSAAAAGGVFFMKSRNAAEQAAAAAAAVTTTQPAVIAQAEPPPANNAPAPAAEPTPEPASAAPEAANKTAKPVVAAKGGAPKVAAAPAPAPAPAKPEGPAKMTEKDLAAAPAGPAGDLGAAMKKEVGDAPAATPAAATTGANTVTGNVPQKPSQGAVTGALGAVLPGARACLGPDDPISRASVVFSSAGTVQSVSVSGAAAGKPAEACIKNALMKAKVQPFAEPSYTAPVTIRHN